LKDAEAYLRDVGGFSKSQALGLVARIKATQGRSNSDEQAELAELLKRGTSLISNH
jgi:hypothetical protein